MSAVITGENFVRLSPGVQILRAMPLSNEAVKGEGVLTLVSLPHPPGVHKSDLHSARLDSAPGYADRPDPHTKVHYPNGLNRGLISASPTGVVIE